MKTNEQTFTEFLNQLQNGGRPDAANHDMRYALQLRQERLKKHDLTLEWKFHPEGGVMNKNCVSHDYNMIRFRQMSDSLYFQLGDVISCYYRRKEKAAEKKEFVVLYQSIQNQDKEQPDPVYICPGCGGITTIEALEKEGCPFCGSHFKMDELFPKVVNFYTFNEGMYSKKQSKRYVYIIVAVSILLGILQSAGFYRLHPDMNVFMLLITFFFSCFFPFVTIYLFFSVFLFGRFAQFANNARPVTRGNKETETLIKEKISSYDPAFNYEYFEGKALSLVRTLLLKDNPDTFAQYAGDPLYDRFHDILNVEYRGGIGLNSFFIHDDHIFINLKLFLKTAVDNQGTIEFRDEDIDMVMKHHLRFPVNSKFSIMKVQCTSCGGSFDARKEKYCPYCNRPFKSDESDWLVTLIKR